MRIPVLLPALLLSCFCAAQDLPSDLEKVPAWMVTLLTDQKPSKAYKPKGKPLHTNQFIGTWEIKTAGDVHYEFWSDAHRIVIREPAGRWSPERATLIDLQANVKLTVGWGRGDMAGVEIEDLYIPKAGYFHELFSDTVIPTGKSETIMGQECAAFVGYNRNNDSTWYWRTDVHPALFADLRAWASWLCRDRDLRYLCALSDETAGNSLKVAWRGRKYSDRESGSMTFTVITPGAVPMPVMDLSPSHVAEKRRLWMNNTRLGRVPDWMRASVNPLPPHPLPVEYTPPIMDRGIPDNKFIGTFTAETSTRYINGKDTTTRVAKYSYWADARRAVVQLDDPEDEGYVAYLVDLDADVAMVAVDEMSSALPRLYIGTLADAGLDEFGRGVEMEFTPQGKYQTIAGRKCELNISAERFLHFFWFPTKSVLNPVFDMAHWIEKRPAYAFKDVMVFGVADKPMPMAVMGTYITSYKPGKAKPPVLDLSNYGIRDERLSGRREEERQVQEIRVAPFGGTGDVPEPVVEEMMPMVTQEEGEVMEAMDAVPDMPMDIDEAPAQVDTPPIDIVHEDFPAPAIAAGAGAEVPAFLENYLNTNVNRFLGSATLLFRWVHDDKIITWTVRYWSTAERSVLISKGSEALPSIRTQAWLIDRKANRETQYEVNADSTVSPYSQSMRTAFLSATHSFVLDTADGTRRDLLDRPCIHRRHQSTYVRRDAWVDAELPSFYMDLYSARKGWEGMDHILHGKELGTPVFTLPLMVDFTGPKDRFTMKVMSLTPGPVDPAVFTISREDFR